MQKYTPHRRIHHQVGGAPSSIPDPNHYYVMSGTTGETDIGTSANRDLTETGTVLDVTSGGKNGNARDTQNSASNYLRNTSLDTDAAYKGTSVWSASCWAKFNGISATTNAFAGTSGYVRLSTATTLNWGDSGTLNHTTASKTTGVWYHFAWGYDGANRWCTADNETPTELAVGTVAFSAVGSWGFGGGWTLNGAIDEVAIFEADIRGDALTELYNSGTGKFWDGSSWA